MSLTETRPAALDRAALAAALAAACSGIKPEQAVEFGAGIAAALGALNDQLPTPQEAQQVPTGEAIVTVEPDRAALAAAITAAVPGIAPEQAAKFGAGIAMSIDAFDGQLPTREEAQQIPAGEAIVTIKDGCKVTVHPTIARMRQQAMRKAQRARPPVRRSAPRLSSQPRAARTPRRSRRPAAAVRACDDGGGGDDPDPEQPRPLTADPEIQTPNAPSAVAAEVRP